MRHEGSGQALVEYVVLLAVGSLIAIGTVSLAGTQLSQAYSQVTTLLANPAAAIVPTASPSTSELATATTTTPTAPGATAPSATASSPTAPTPTPGASHGAADAAHSAGHAVGNGHAHD